MPTTPGAALLRRLYVAAASLAACAVVDARSSVHLTCDNNLRINPPEGGSVEIGKLMSVDTDGSINSAQMKEFSEKMARMGGGLATATANIAVLTEDNVALKADNANFATEISTLKQDKAALLAQVGDLEVAAAANASDAQATLATLTSGYANLTSEVAALKQEKAALITQVGDLEAAALSKCVAGEFGTATGGCDYCPHGTFSDGPGQSACKSCPLGYTTEPSETKDMARSTRLYKHASERQCYEHCTLPQSLCPAGMYFSVSSNKCLACSSGSFTTVSGKTKCEPCPIGQYGNGSTILKIDGHDVIVNGPTHCVACPSGLTTASAGRPSIENCDLVVGYTQRTATVTNGGFFHNCGKLGLINDAKPACSCGSSCNCANAKYNCKNCPAGQFGYEYIYNQGHWNSQNPQKETQCKGCLEGTYNDEVGQAICEKCPDGWSGPPSSTSINNCFVSTAHTPPCPAGFYSGKVGYNQNVYCKSCPPGMFQNQTAESRCQLCARGTFSTGAAASCTACPNGKTTREGGYIDTRDNETDCVY